MSNEDVSRMFMPQRKVVTRSASSSSLASNSSTSSATTVTSTNDTAHSANGDAAVPAKKKQRGGFWPVSKAESTSSVTNARANGAVQPAAQNGSNALAQKNSLQPAVPEHANNTVNGVTQRSQNTALLVLLPMNGTFERKQINVPIHPDPPQKIGRQTNNKTTPKADNGYFDSKVLSRQHAEIWADVQGRVWIRDVKSSNGTFVNGTRLSPENRESEPSELRQHDSLELGIDIVSEDQKTIVHHKVSAKVEFSGFPGKAGNALDLLSFGELDPSQGMLNSPISAPMAHSRSHQGRPLSRGSSVASGTTVGNISSVSQRQANYWGTPLNVEQLVKQVGIEMRAAKQQASDLDQARSFLTAILPVDGSPARIPPGKEFSQSSKHSNGRVKAPRIDHSARFAEPPAPPPQQPLPEKPDSTKVSSPSSTSLNSMLKREATAKPLLNGVNVSPTGGQNSQILALIDSLNEAKKQIESQGSKVRELEDMLRQERQAREAAEAKMKRMEETQSARPITHMEQEDQIKKDSKSPEKIQSSEQDPAVETESQERLNMAYSQLEAMRQELHEVKQQRESAESEKSSLAAMIEKYRKEREKDDVNAVTTADKENDVEEIPRSSSDLDHTNATVKGTSHANGQLRTPRLPEHLQHAVSTVLQQQANGEVPAHYAPYVSMMGVVLIGVGVMAYLNSWQKVDK